MTETGETIGEIAASWVVRLNSDQRTRADEEAFRLWMEEDPAHADAFADCVALWDGVRRLAASDDGHKALRRLRAPVRVFGPVTRRTAVFGGASVAAAAAASVAAFMTLGREQILQTAPGEQKHVRLDDGTSVLLNTDSRLRIRLSRSERRLYLDRGQAFFQVAADKARPFRVFVGHDEVRAIGTAFEVRRLGDSVQVTLEEGRVAIYHAGKPSPQALGRVVGPNVASRPAVSSGPVEPVAVLSPGEQAVLASIRPIAVREVDLRKVQAWRYGRMILDDAPLGDTVADLNRYGGVQIVLADPKLADIRVSGVFHTGRPDDFVKSVTAAFPIEIAREDDQTIVLRAR
jgi:transmembrane sensor